MNPYPYPNSGNKVSNAGGVPGAAPPPPNSGGAPDAYATYYNSLSPSTRAFMHVPGSAGQTYANQQAAASNALFAAQGVTDPWDRGQTGALAPPPPPPPAQPQTPPVPEGFGPAAPPPPAGKGIPEMTPGTQTGIGILPGGGVGGTGPYVPAATPSGGTQVTPAQNMAPGTQQTIGITPTGGVGETGAYRMPSLPPTRGQQAGSPVVNALMRRYQNRYW